MNKNIKIQYAQKKDKEQILQIYLLTADYHSEIDSTLKSGQELVERSRRNIDEIFADELSDIILAKIEDEVVGILAFKIKNGAEYSTIDRFGFITKAFVIERCRNMGIMKLLMQEVKKYLNSRDIKYLKLSVASNNKLGLKSWERLGFKESSRIMRKEI